MNDEPIKVHEVSDDELAAVSPEYAQHLETKKVKEQRARDFPPGMRVRLTYLEITPGGFDDTPNLPPGSTGTVSGTPDDAGTLPVKWDHGPQLGATVKDVIERVKNGGFLVTISPIHADDEETDDIGADGGIGEPLTQFRETETDTLGAKIAAALRLYADVFAFDLTIERVHDCHEEAVYVKTDGPLGHGWECGQCGAFLQAG